MAYVFSTLTCPQEYTGWTKAPDGSPRVGRQVRIEGGHGVMNKHFLTPLGVATEVSDDELAFLETVDAFKLHRDAGFIKVQAKSVPTEKAVVDMAQRDESAPITPADYGQGGRMGDIKEPTVTGGA